MSQPPSLFKQIVSHPVAVSMFFFAALVFGMVSYGRLPVQLMPDLSYPTLTVRTVYEGAAPEEVEDQVSRPIEESLATLDGLVSLESRSRAGLSEVILGFEWGSNMDAAAQTIRESLQLSRFSRDAERPLLLRYDPTLEPVMRLAIAPSDGDTVGLLALRQMAEQEVKRSLEALPGVAAVRVRGGLQAEVRVDVREDWLASHRLSLDEVVGAIRSENVNIAGGSIVEGDVEYLVRTVNQFSDMDELAALQITRSDGVIIPLREVADVHRGFTEREELSRYDGEEAVELELYKEADANVVAVSAAVSAALSTGLGLPDTVQLVVLDDQARFIGAALSNVWQTVLIGGFFAIFVLYLFLRDLRSTVIIGVSIPVSVIIAFSPLYLQGITLNLMSLGGLALGVGMLVDNAVVVLESIVRHRDQGEGPVTSAVLGVSEVAQAVIASTLTTVAVFLPIAFVEGVGGELFGDLSLAVVGALMASLAVALFLVPTLSALEWVPVPIQMSALSALERLFVPGTSIKSRLRCLWRAWRVEVFTAARAEWSASVSGSRGQRSRVVRWPYWAFRWVLQVCAQMVWVSGLWCGAACLRVSLWAGAWLIAPPAAFIRLCAALFEQLYSPVRTGYPPFLRSLLAHRGAVIGVAALLFLASLLGLGQLGQELIPEVHQGRFAVDLSLPVGSPLFQTDRLIRSVESVIERNPEVSAVYSTVGAAQGADTRSNEGSHSARVHVQLKPSGQPAGQERRVKAELRAQLSEVQATLGFSRPSLFSVRTPVEVVLYGYELAQLRRVADRIRDELTQIPGLKDVRSSLEAGHPEVQVVYDRAQLRRFGLDPATVATRVRDRVQGVEATQLQQDDRTVPVRVQLVERDRSSLADLARLNINPTSIPEIPLSAVATLIEAEGPSEIRRVEQQRAVVVSANLEGLDLGSMAALIEARLSVLPLEGLHAEVVGQSKEMASSSASMKRALFLALFLVYVIMASTFESLLHPMVILFSVPLALVGVVVSLGVLGLSVSVIVLIGVIVLAGVVVNNAIVLVDAMNRLREEGVGDREAIERAATTRLRPILITTATTVLGLVPLSLGWGSGAEIQQPLAVAVVGGLLSSTFLTLGVIPVVYSFGISEKKT